MEKNLRNKNIKKKKKNENKIDNKKDEIKLSKLGNINETNIDNDKNIS